MVIVSEQTLRSSSLEKKNLYPFSLFSGYADGGDAPDKQIKLVPGAIKDAKGFLKQHSDTRIRFEKVGDLLEGFESPFGLELLSTIHWVIKNEPVNSIDEVISHTYSWNNRKKQFTPRQISLAVETLSSKGWANKPTLESAYSSRG